ncbi:MAG: carbamoyl-phosphate synthase small subunit [Sphingobacteriia bacterium]|nr:carbamoyl-phosphate synthase small subunit [Sphingobacteriia bacterium]
MVIRENSSPTAVLQLSDGTRWIGSMIGVPGTTLGEICFNTGMTGYQEIFSDPSYFGQIVIMTHTHIGNYGVKKSEAESNRIQLSGLVCKTFSPDYSRHSADGSLAEELIQANITGISGIDTRELVRHIRNVGAINAIISTEYLEQNELAQLLQECPSMEGLDLSSLVSITSIQDFGSGSLKIAAYDFGIKHNIIRCLERIGAQVRLFPNTAPAEELIQWEPHGFFLSNGPGDPGAMHFAVTQIQKLFQTGKPMFGICLGHQLLALAAGVPTYKMFNGHRGINHPVINLQTGKAEITSQNHGFSVSRKELENHPELELTHVHLNDNSVAGFRYKNAPVFSVQFHPEAAPGPWDSRYLFQQFKELMEAHRVLQN